MECFKEMGDFAVIGFVVYCSIAYLALALGLVVRGALWLIKSWWNPLNI